MTATAREVFEPFAHSPADRRETHRFRSSWLSSSLRALRARDLMTPYLAHLPRELHETIVGSVAGVWLPVNVARAHYASIDALGLPARTAFEMGGEINVHSQSTLTQFVLRSSKAAGVTPWVLFRHFRTMWDRTWSGGDFAVYKLGPKEAEVEVVAWSIAASPYVRHAMRGIFQSLTTLFCTKAYVTEVGEKCSGLSLSYRFAWA